MELTTGTTSSPNGGDKMSDIIHALDFMRSSRHHVHTPSPDGAAEAKNTSKKKKRTLMDVYDDCSTSSRKSTIPPLAESKGPAISPPPPLPPAEVFESLPSKKSRQDEVSPPIQSLALYSKVLPSAVGMINFNTEDVLSGRGGGTNQHEGNCYFRSLINSKRELYLRSKKNDKPFISRSIVNAIRQKNGRFLKRDEKSGLWYEIGDDAAREKTSQALRQRAPEFRRQIYEKDCAAIRKQQQVQVQQVQVQQVQLPQIHQQLPNPACTLTTAATTPAITAVVNTDSLISTPLSPHALSTVSIATPSLSPYYAFTMKKDSLDSNDAVLQMYNASLLQAELQKQAQQQALCTRLREENIQETLRLEQKLRTMKMLEMMTRMGNGALS